MPPITRAYATGCFLTTLACVRDPFAHTIHLNLCCLYCTHNLLVRLHRLRCTVGYLQQLEIVSPLQLYFNYDLIVYDLEVLQPNVSVLSLVHSIYNVELRHALTFVLCGVLCFSFSLFPPPPPGCFFDCGDCCRLLDSLRTGVASRHKLSVFWELQYRFRFPYVFFGALLPHVGRRVVSWTRCGLHVHAHPSSYRDFGTCSSLRVVQMVYIIYACNTGNAGSIRVWHTDSKFPPLH